MVQDRVIERVVHGLRWNALLELGIGIRNEGGGFAANIYGAMPEGWREEVGSQMSDP